MPWKKESFAFEMSTNQQMFGHVCWYLYFLLFEKIMKLVPHKYELMTIELVYLAFPQDHAKMIGLEGFLMPMLKTLHSWAPYL